VSLASPFDELKTAEQSWDIADLTAALTTLGKQHLDRPTRSHPVGWWFE